MLEAHDARWTTHGDVRLYDVLHCVSRDCNWSLRLKARMYADDCYAAHRTHVAEVLAALIPPCNGQHWSEIVDSDSEEW